MNLDVDFVSVMSILGLDMRRRGKLYSCPFCPAKHSLEVFPDQMAKCHNKKCNWSGDALKLYRKWKNVSKDEAFKELSVALGDGSLLLKAKSSEFKEQTYAEAKSELAKDLEFLAWVRMSEGFNPDYTREEVVDKSGVTKGTLSKIIKGQMVNALTWRKVLNVLRIDLEPRIKIMKRAIDLGPKYFEDLIDDEQRGKDVEKYRIKKPKRPRTKIVDKE